jgi:transcriptional regulator with XRE-family HTH domain
LGAHPSETQLKTSESEPVGPPNHLRAWRKAAGLTQAQVEKILSWQPARVSHLERGSARITDEVLRYLASLYGGEPGDLLHAPPPPARRQAQVAVLEEAESRLRCLLDEFHTIKGDLVPRLDTLESQLTTLTAAIVEAVESAVETREMLARTMAVINRATGNKPSPAAPSTEAEPASPNETNHD